MTEDTPKSASRRDFIKGVIAAGAVVSSATYLFRSIPLSGQSANLPTQVLRELHK